MAAIPFSSIMAGYAVGLTFELLDRPFDGPRPIDPSWGTRPTEFEAWFCHERGPEATGIVHLDRAHIFGTELIYAERDGERHALEIDQNFLSGASAAAELARMETARANGTMTLREIDGEIVLLPGHPYFLYGHWMVDFMPRIQLLRTSGRDIAGLRFLLPSDLPAFAHEWFDLAGIAPAQRVLYDKATELCRCERALIPTNLRHGGRASPIMGEAAIWMTQIAGAEATSPTRRLYVSRENWGNITRKLENFPAVETVMADYGFEIVFPEKLPIPEQAKLLASARFVAGDYGSGLHNSIFGHPDIQVVALRGTDLHPGFLQSGLCEVRSQHLSYVFGRTWANERGFQHYEIALDDLRQCLDQTLGSAA